MINETRLLNTFLELVRIDSPSGEESAIARELAVRLRGLGLAPELDSLGNLLAYMAGDGKPLLLAAHMDTVMPGRGINPVVQDGVVRSDGTTILAADDKSGIAVILELLQTIAEHHVAHPPLEVVITVQEETGLAGAKGLDKSRLRARTGISFDAGGPPGTIIVSAPSHNLVSAVVLGKAAHAGAQPEEGISAIVVAAQAVAAMPLGRLDEETTANIGMIHGGTARNVVPERVELQGEARSRQLAKLERQTQAMVDALQSAARHSGARVEISVERAYDGYALTQADGVVKQLVAACRAVGVESTLMATGGGSDANVFNAHGMQVVNLSTGVQKVHTVEEQISVADMVACAEIALEYIRMTA
jgi:tripeptide aminopeptidase